MKTFRIALMIVAALAITSCEKDDNKKGGPSGGNGGGGGGSAGNHLTLDGKKTTLKAGVLEYYGTQDTVGLYNYDIALVSTNLVEKNGELEPADSNFTFIYFELFTKDSGVNLPIGTYTYSQTEKDFSLTYAEIGTDVDTIWHYIPSGTFKVVQNSPVYELSFSGTTFLGEAVSMYYKGNLYKEDESGSNIAAKMELRSKLRSE